MVPLLTSVPRRNDPVWDAGRHQPADLCGATPLRRYRRGYGLPAGREPAQLALLRAVWKVQRAAHRGQARRHRRQWCGKGGRVYHK